MGGNRRGRLPGARRSRRRSGSRGRAATAVDLARAGCARTFGKNQRRLGASLLTFTVALVGGPASAGAFEPANGQTVTYSPSNTIVRHCGVASVSNYSGSGTPAAPADGDERTLTRTNIYAFPRPGEWSICRSADPEGATAPSPEGPYNVAEPDFSVPPWPGSWFIWKFKTTERQAFSSGSGWVSNGVGTQTGPREVKRFYVVDKCSAVLKSVKGRLRLSRGTQADAHSYFPQLDSLDPMQPKDVFAPADEQYLGTNEESFATASKQTTATLHYIRGADLSIHTTNGNVDIHESIANSHADPYVQQSCAKQPLLVIDVRESHDYGPGGTYRLKSDSGTTAFGSTESNGFDLHYPPSTSPSLPGSGSGSGSNGDPFIVPAAGSVVDLKLDDLSHHKQGNHGERLRVVKGKARFVAYLFTKKKGGHEKRYRLTLKAGRCFPVPKALGTYAAQHKGVACKHL